MATSSSWELSWFYRTICLAILITTSYNKTCKVPSKWLKPCSTILTAAHKRLTQWVAWSFCLLCLKTRTRLNLLTTIYTKSYTSASQSSTASSQDSTNPIHPWSSRSSACASGTTVSKPSPSLSKISGPSPSSLASIRQLRIWRETSRWEGSYSGWPL